MSEPRTEAGKRLLDWLYLNGGAFRTEDRDHIEAAILAIEGEAAMQSSPVELREAEVDAPEEAAQFLGMRRTWWLDGARWAMNRWRAALRAVPAATPQGPVALRAALLNVAEAAQNLVGAVELGRPQDYLRLASKVNQAFVAAKLPVDDEGLVDFAALRAVPAEAEEALPDNACGVMGLCELRKGHEGKHTTSVDRALEGVVLRAAPPSSVDGEGLRAAASEVIAERNREGYFAARSVEFWHAVDRLESAFGASGSASGAAEEGPE